MPVQQLKVVPTSVPQVPIFRAGLGRRMPFGHMRIGVATTLPNVLRDLGIAPEALFPLEGVSVDLFADPDNAIPFANFCGLFSRCKEATGRDDLGLLVCEKAGASDLGLVGFLLMQAPDVRTALGDLVRYLHHSDRGAVPFMTVQDGLVGLGYSIHEPNLPGTEQMYDGALAVGRNIMRGVCGAQWTPLEVTLSRRRPASPSRYERFFDAPIRFDADQSVIFFSEKWLDTPIPHADPALRRMLQEQIDLLEVEEAGKISEQVRRLLRTGILTSSGSFDDVSHLLRMSRRTLARHLEAEGTSFKHLSQEVCFDVARQLLMNTSLTMTDISLTLNYSEASAFTRAFRHWSGTTPRQWRTNHVRQR